VQLLLQLKQLLLQGCAARSRLLLLLLLLLLLQHLQLLELRLSLVRPVGHVRKLHRLLMKGRGGGGCVGIIMGHDDCSSAACVKWLQYCNSMH